MTKESTTSKKPDVTTKYLQSQGYKPGRRLYVITVSSNGVTIDDSMEYKLNYKLPASMREAHEQIDNDEFMLSKNELYACRTHLYTDSLLETQFFTEAWDPNSLMNPISNGIRSSIVAHEGNLKEALAYAKTQCAYLANKTADAYRKRADEIIATISQTENIGIDDAKRHTPVAKKLHPEFWFREFNNGNYRVCIFSVDENYTGAYTPGSRDNHEMLYLRVDERDSSTKSWVPIDGSLTKTHTSTRYSDELVDKLVYNAAKQISAALNGDGDFASACKKSAQACPSSLPSFIKPMHF